MGGGWLEGEEDGEGAMHLNWILILDEAWVLP